MPLPRPRLSLFLKRFARLSSRGLHRAWRRIPAAARPLVISLAALSLLIFLLVSLPYLALKGSVQRQISQAARGRGVVSETETKLLQLPTPSAVTLGVRRSGDNYVAKLEQVSKTVQPLKLRPPWPIWPLAGWLNPTIKTAAQRHNQLRRDSYLAETYQLSGESVTQAKELLDYHSGVMQSLAKVLEYNAQADFLNFDRNSDDTKIRLERAKSGLKAAADNIEMSANTQKDPTIKEVQLALSELQAERDRLERERDLDRWVGQSRRLQQQILDNRVRYWGREVQRIKAQTSAAEQQLTEVLARWRQIEQLYQ